MNQQDRNLHPLGIPRDWVERRLAVTDPSLTKDAIDGLRVEVSELHDVVVSLNMPLNFSCFPNGMETLAEAVGHSQEQLLHSLTADLSEGVVVQATDWTTHDGHRKVVLLGSRWRLVVRPQSGEQTGRTLAVIEKVQRQDVPPRRLSFAPTAVRFEPIWEELPCDLEDLLESYTNCLRKAQDRKAACVELEQSLSKSIERRGEAMLAIRKELRRGLSDSDARGRNSLHISIRKHYSALRSMMDLLKLRTERQQIQFEAQVSIVATQVPDVDSTGAESSAGTTSVRLVVPEESLSAPVEENALLEIRGDILQSCRCRVLSTTRSNGYLTIDTDADAAVLMDSAAVQVSILSRFGLRAHQRAVYDLLNENVDGYWPHMAQLLCEPGSLSVHADPDAPQYFFCDSDKDLPPLNDRQRQAVTGALATPHAYCIQGPPGTGKTTVICELIQQLLARGERVLLTAPTHVAVDEVLRRIGSREGIRPLRLSWDEGRIADDVRKYAPANIIDPFTERVLLANDGRVTQWSHERESCSQAITLLDDLASAQDRYEAATEQRASAEAAVNLSAKLLSTREPQLVTHLCNLKDQIAAQGSQLTGLKDNLRAAEEALNQSRESVGFEGRFLGLLGVGEIGRLNRLRRNEHRRLARGKGALRTLKHQHSNTTAEIKQIKRAADNASERLQKCMVAEISMRDARDNLLHACRAHALLQNISPAKSDLDAKRIELCERSDRIENYTTLRSRFDELVADVASNGTDRDGLRRDLLAVSNLFCCTTTGIAGSKELADVSFDTIIVDEASRVTDSEFLIGAVRAKRWILVGDEHQLPPYVEQQDEHFLHGLSALARSEATAEPLEVAVEALGTMWEEDEELHKFRAESVLRIAHQLQQSDDWSNFYRAAFREAEEFIAKEHSDPSRALLEAMRNQMVHSLFERVVTASPPSLRIRLVEQRRMIAPLARIVSEPIYGGDYVTPEESKLAERGITPLVTPTFPKPVTFLDTSALGIHARDELLGNSFVNRVEARWIVEACEVLNRELMDMGSDPVSVSILTFYKAQARLIREQLLPDHSAPQRLEYLRFSVIDAIDRIQGQESDVVFLSFCRTAGTHVTPRFGQWLQDLRRVNVACTRAHRALILVGQKELLGRLCSNEPAQAFYSHLNALFEQHADVMERKIQFAGGGK